MEPNCARPTLISAVSPVCGGLIRLRHSILRSRASGSRAKSMPAVAPWVWAGVAREARFTHLPVTAATPIGIDGRPTSFGENGPGYVQGTSGMAAAREVPAHGCRHLPGMWLSHDRLRYLRRLSSARRTFRGRTEQGNAGWRVHGSGPAPDRTPSNRSHVTTFGEGSRNAG